MLLRHSARTFWKRAVALRAAADAGAPAAAKASPVPDGFKGEWKKVVPNLEPPSFSSKFMVDRRPVPSTIPEKLTINVVLPHGVLHDNQEVDMVIIPATSGQMGVLPGHVPTVAKLQPGVMSVHDGSTVKSYFVSAGFAFVHANSITDVCAAEAVPLEDLDPEAVKAGLAKYTQLLTTAKTDLEQAEAQIGVEVHSAMSGALGL